MTARTVLKNLVYLPLIPAALACVTVGMVYDAMRWRQIASDFRHDLRRAVDPPKEATFY